SSATEPGTVGVLLNTSVPVTAAATTTTLATSAPTTVFGPSELLTATVSSKAGTPTGTITFLDGNTVLGTARVNDVGQATIKAAPGARTHQLPAPLGANGGLADSPSAPVTEPATRAAPTVALHSSVTPAATGQAVTFTATVAVVAPGAGAPTGTV